MLMAVIVVIEDDPLIYLPLSEALREHGYTVFTTWLYRFHCG